MTELPQATSRRELREREAAAGARRTSRRSRRRLPGDLRRRPASFCVESPRRRPSRRLCPPRSPHADSLLRRRHRRSPPQPTRQLGRPTRLTRPPSAHDQASPAVRSSVGALLFAAALAVGMSVPANAFSAAAGSAVSSSTCGDRLGPGGLGDRKAAGHEPRRAERDGGIRSDDRRRCPTTVSRCCRGRRCSPRRYAHGQRLQVRGRNGQRPLAVPRSRRRSARPTVRARLVRQLLEQLPRAASTSSRASAPRSSPSRTAWSPTTRDGVTGPRQQRHHHPQDRQGHRHVRPTRTCRPVRVRWWSDRRSTSATSSAWSGRPARRPARTSTSGSP